MAKLKMPDVLYVEHQAEGGQGVDGAVGEPGDDVGAEREGCRSAARPTTRTATTAARDCTVWRASASPRPRIASEEQGVELLTAGTPRRAAARRLVLLAVVASSSVRPAASGAVGTVEALHARRRPRRRPWPARCPPGESSAATSSASVSTGTTGASIAVAGGDVGQQESAALAKGAAAMQKPGQVADPARAAARPPPRREEPICRLKVASPAATYQTTATTMPPRPTVITQRRRSSAPQSSGRAGATAAAARRCRGPSSGAARWPPPRPSAGGDLVGLRLRSRGARPRCSRTCATRRAGRRKATGWPRRRAGRSRRCRPR